MDAIDRYALLLVGGAIVLWLLWSGLDFVRDLLGLLFKSGSKRD